MSFRFKNVMLIYKVNSVVLTVETRQSISCIKCVFNLIH